MPEDRGRSKGGFKVLESFLIGQGLVKRNTLTGKGNNQANKAGKSTDKVTVEVSKAKEALYILQVRRRLLGYNYINLSRVHSYP